MQTLITVKVLKSRSGIYLTCTLRSVNIKCVAKPIEGAQNCNKRKNIYINIGLLKRGFRITAFCTIRGGYFASDFL